MVGKSFEVLIVPCGENRSVEKRGCAQSRGVVAYTETVGIVYTAPSILYDKSEDCFAASFLIGLLRAIAVVQGKREVNWGNTTDIPVKS